MHRGRRPVLASQGRARTLCYRRSEFPRALAGTPLRNSRRGMSERARQRWRIAASTAHHVARSTASSLLRVPDSIVKSDRRFTRFVAARASTRPALSTISQQLTLPHMQGHAGTRKDAQGQARTGEDLQGRAQGHARTCKDRCKDTQLAGRVQDTQGHAQGHARTFYKDMRGHSVLARHCDARTDLWPR
jgi:hypothetical protein